MGKLSKCLFLGGCYLPVKWLGQLGGSPTCVHVFESTSDLKKQTRTFCRLKGCLDLSRATAGY